jgi:hypothetical protein
MTSLQTLKQGAREKAHFHSTERNDPNEGTHCLEIGEVLELIDRTVTAVEEAVVSDFEKPWGEENLRNSFARFKGEVTESV